jgi:tubulin polyglutamylase TTLL6/13
MNEPILETAFFGGCVDEEYEAECEADHKEEVQPLFVCAQPEPSASSGTDGTKKDKKRKRFTYYLETRYNIVRQVFSEQEVWQQIFDPNGDFDFIWTDVSMPADRFAKLERKQRYNHFIGMSAITRKNNLGRNLIRMKKFFSADYSFFPETWILPTDYPDFKYQFRKGRTYIVKPDNSCQGKGIFLTQSLESIELDFSQGLVAQTYIRNPLLLDGFKFDLRVYVLVTGSDPLRIYIHSEGLVRLCCTPYERISDSNISNTTMHLTNYAINVQSSSFQENRDPSDIHDGHKRSMRLLFTYLESQGHNVGNLLFSIDDLVIKTLIAVQPSVSHVNYSCQPDDFENCQSFEILGFDILLDAKLNPWLLEVNHAPSFGTDSELDKLVKHAVINDALRLVRLGVKRKKRAGSFEKSGNIKDRAHERHQQSIICAVERDLKENNFGGYRKIYPTPDGEEKYKRFHEKAIEVWETLTGGRGRRPVRIFEAAQSPRLPTPPRGVSLPPLKLPLSKKKLVGKQRRKHPRKVKSVSPRSHTFRQQRTPLAPSITSPILTLPENHIATSKLFDNTAEAMPVSVGNWIRIQTNFGWEPVVVEKVYKTHRLDIRFADGQAMTNVAPKIWPLSHVYKNCSRLAFISPVVFDMEVLSWDEYFMSVAFLSSLRSVDPQWQGGACVVNPENRIVGIGYCGLPRGMEDHPENFDPKFFVCHSIMNAILNKNQYDIRGCRIYSTRYPCNECAKLIIQAGITRVTYSSGPIQEASQILFSLAGVSICQYMPKRRKAVELKFPTNSNPPTVISCDNS